MRGCYRNKPKVIWLLIGWVILSLPACERSSTRKRIYVETVLSPTPEVIPMASSTDQNPHALLQDQAVLFVWDLPQGWIEKPGGGMRIATITNPQSPELEISIVSLSGAAGGISLNLNRWMKQIDLPELNEQALDEFFKKQKTFKAQGDLTCLLVDFTTLQLEKDLSTPSMLVGVVAASGQTVFVKMTGSLSAIDQNRDAFQALCQSFKIKD